jgi:hypothetical protein
MEGNAAPRLRHNAHGTPGNGMPSGDALKPHDDPRIAA